MDPVIKTILWSAPLSIVLVSVLAWILRQWLTERLISSIRHEYNKDLAAHQAQLKAQFDAELEVRKSALKAQSDAALEVHKAFVERWSHIDKAHFDMEFNSFQKLWTAVSMAVDKTYVVQRLYDRSDTPKGKGERHRNTTEADAAFFVAMGVAQELRPFIPLPIHTRVTALLTRCKAEIDFFFQYLRVSEAEGHSEDLYEEAKERSRDARAFLTREWDQVAEDIRERLGSYAAAPDHAQNG